MFSRQLIATATIACFLALGMNGAMANIIGTNEVLAANQRAIHLTAVENALANTAVQEKLVALGVDPAAASTRAASLTDEELVAVAARLDSLPAGGDGLLVVIGIVFVVLFILELTGVIDIFKRA